MCFQFTFTKHLKSNPSYKITVLKHNQLELISGNSGGFISVWWLENGMIQQQCKAHDGPVTDLQFDATKIVSSGMDCLIKVIDITTCHIMQSLRGHTGPIISIAFDNKMMITLSRDGSICQWPWGNKLHSSLGGDTVHTVMAGETISTICKKYSVSLLQIIKWNKSKEAKNISPGQTLIVKKAMLHKSEEECLASEAWKLGTIGTSSSRNSEVEKQNKVIHEADSGASLLPEYEKDFYKPLSKFAERKRFYVGEMEREHLLDDPSTLASRLIAKHI